LHRSGFRTIHRLWIKCRLYRFGLASELAGCIACCARVTSPAVVRVDTKDLFVMTERQSRRLILFDLDGTLVNVAALHLEAFRVAMQTVYGLDIEGVLDRRSYQGDTQPNVVRAACRIMGVSSETTDALLPDALQIASETTIALLEQDLGGVVLPGVVRLLEILEEGGQVLGLVTGTVSPTAQAIVKWAGVQQFFSLHACGDEGRERADLVRLAVERAVPLLGWRADARELVVIGDAPRDIETGKVFGARTVAVATGNHTVGDLAAYAPDVVLANFGDVEAALAAILGSGEGPHLLTAAHL
jgi:phosphoglycolate phosphatase